MGWRILLSGGNLAATFVNDELIEIGKAPLLVWAAKRDANRPIEFENSNSVFNAASTMNYSGSGSRPPNWRTYSDCGWTLDMLGSPLSGRPCLPQRTLGLRCGQGCFDADLGFCFQVPYSWCFGIDWCHEIWQQWCFRWLALLGLI
jgi:hypothetical protein